VTYHLTPMLPLGNLQESPQDRFVRCRSPPPSGEEQDSETEFHIPSDISPKRQIGDILVLKLSDTNRKKKVWI
jgi:hypothetical protein